MIVFAWHLNAGHADAPEFADAPKWLDSAKVDLVAQVPAGAEAIGLLNQDPLRLALQSLLKNRFKIAFHTELRPGTGWVLKASKPKLAKADPASRTSCRLGSGDNGRAASQEVITCRNVTMTQFAERLPVVAGEYARGSDDVRDETGLTGSYDFAVSFSPAELVAGTPLNSAFAPLLGGRGGNSAAAAPTGAVSLADAVNKQLGLKLEQEKRPVPTFVLDRIEQPPPE
jgi:uncharacterized protein (TIGR03435 family)